MFSARIPAAMALLASAAIAWSPGPPAVGAEPLQLAPQEGMLLLRNGSVVRGKVSRVGPRYLVALNAGELRIRADQVEFFSRTLDEAYRRKRDTMGTATGSDHIALAEWCLRHGLLNQTAEALQMARRVDPEHARLPLCERRLQLALHPPRHVASPPTAERAEPATDGADRPTSKPTRDRFDAASLPTGALEEYTSAVQPLLLNRCATAGCHGPRATNRLQLERFAVGRPMSRNVTLRNLESTLRCVDLDEPSASPLLRKPLAPHGAGGGPMFGPAQRKQFEALSTWVYNISAGSAVAEADAPPGRAGGFAPDADSAPASSAPQGGRTLWQTLLRDDPTARDRLTGNAAAIGPEKGISTSTPRGVTQAAAPGASDGAPPADPFDPAEFNRRYAPRPEKAPDEAPESESEEGPAASDADPPGGAPDSAESGVDDDANPSAAGG